MEALRHTLKSSFVRLLLTALVAINLELLMAALQKTNHYEMYLYFTCSVMRPEVLSIG